jgi:hypothetical protein
MTTKDKYRIESLILTVNKMLCGYLQKETSTTAKKKYLSEIKANEELFKRLQPKKIKL